MKKADAIFTADWHLREDQPTCRTDNFQETQWEKVRFVKELQAAHGCPVIHSGDLFDYWKPSPALLSTAMEYIPAEFYTVYGNHDLPQHSLELAHKSGLYCLEKAGALGIINGGGHWKVPYEEISPIEMAGRKVAVCHTMTYQGEIPYPGCTDLKDVALLRKFKDVDVVVTGHNHRPFVAERGGRLIVNPGSLSRQTAADDFKPRIYLYYAEDNTVLPVYLPIVDGAVSRQHIEKVEERDDRIDAFISTLQEEFEASFDFEKNMEDFFRRNTVKESVKKIIYASMGK